MSAVPAKDGFLNRNQRRRVDGNHEDICEHLSTHDACDAEVVLPPKLNASLQLREIAVRGLVYFAILSIAVLVLHVVTAWVQSRRITPRTVTFTEDSVVVDFKGESVDRGWDWIIAAEESPTLISLLVQKLPRLELYLHKATLDDDEYRTLHEWLVLHGKYL